MHANALDRKFPENDERTLYIRHCSGSYTFEDLKEQILSHFGQDTNIDLLTIDSEVIQERCFGYDLHDPADYGKYFVIPVD